MSNRLYPGQTEGTNLSLREMLLVGAFASTMTLGAMQLKATEPDPATETPTTAVDPHPHAQP